MVFLHGFELFFISLNKLSKLLKLIDCPGNREFQFTKFLDFYAREI